MDDHGRAPPCSLHLHQLPWVVCWSMLFPIPQYSMPHNKFCMCPFHVQCACLDCYYAHLSWTDDMVVLFATGADSSANSWADTFTNKCTSEYNNIAPSLPLVYAMLSKKPIQQEPSEFIPGDSEIESHCSSIFTYLAWWFWWCLGR